MTNRSTPSRRRRRDADVPSLKTRKTASGAVVTYAYFDGRQVSFGPAGPEAQLAFDEHVTRWLANGRSLPDPAHEHPSRDPSVLTVADVVALYLEHAEREYDQRELNQFRQAFRPLLALFRTLPAVQFTAARLTELQHYLANTEFHRSRKNKPPRSYRLSRITISTRIGYIRRCWRWAEAEGIAPEGRWTSLNTVAPVRSGRTQAKEPKPVGAVEWARVEPVLRHLTPTLADVIQVLWHTGARPAEILSMTGRQLDPSGDPWWLHPAQHKGRWRSQPRAIPLNEFAQAIVRPRLQLDPDRAVFSPRDALLEIRERKRAARKTPMTPSQLHRDKTNAAKAPSVGEFYASNELAKAVRRACVLADVDPWTPYDLRRAVAAELFLQGDEEGAQALLGHISRDMSRHYAQTSRQQLAVNAVRRLWQNGR